MQGEQEVPSHLSEVGCSLQRKPQLMYGQQGLFTLELQINLNVQMEQQKIENLNIHDFSNPSSLQDPSYTSAQELFAISSDGICPSVCSDFELILEPWVLQLGQFCRTVLLRTQYIATQGNVVLPSCSVRQIHFPVYEQSTTVAHSPATVRPLWILATDIVVLNMKQLCIVFWSYHVPLFDGQLSEYPVLCRHTIRYMARGLQADTNFEMTRTK